MLPSRTKRETDGVGDGDLDRLCPGRRTSLCMSGCADGKVLTRRASKPDISPEVEWQCGDSNSHDHLQEKQRRLLKKCQ